MVFIVFPMFLSILHRISLLLIVFSNVSELLVKKTLEKQIQNHEFLIFFHHSLKIIMFFFFGFYWVFQCF